MSHTHVIPIHPEGSLHLHVVEPQFQGPAESVQAIVEALKPLVDAEFGLELPAGAWLRELKIEPGEAVMAIAPDLAQHGHMVAMLAFEVMRDHLPDTDIYVGAAPA